MDPNGEVIIEPILNTYHQLHNWTIRANEDRGYREGDMIYVDDSAGRNFFLINSKLEKPIDLNHPKNNKGKLQLKSSFRDFSILKIYTGSGAPSIINTNGKNILKESVYEVEIYDAELIGLQKEENGLFALFNPLTDKQTDYIYKEIHRTQLPGKVIGQKILSNNPNPVSFLIDAEFKEKLLGPYDVFVSKNQERILGRHNNQAVIFDFEGNKQFEISGFRVHPFPFNSLFLLDKFNKIGLINNSGQMVVDTIYNDIRTKGQHSVLFKRENQYGLFSKDWKEQFRIPEKIVEEFPDSKGHYKILDEATGKFGLIDSMGNYLASAEFEEISSYPYLYYLRKEDTTFFKSEDLQTELFTVDSFNLESSKGRESVLSINDKKYVFNAEGSYSNYSPTCNSWL
ncbi:MAG: WG repeat-containing protein, partial [Saprospiraceae bacterium]